MVAQAGPPLVVMAIGLVLWHGVTTTVAGISIHTIGMILVLAAAVWFVVQMIQARSLFRPAVTEEPTADRDRKR